jgi:hypothetical protein
MGEWRYNFSHSLTSALDDESGQLQDPSALPPQGTRPLYLVDRRLDGPQSRSGRGGIRELKTCFSLRISNGLFIYLAII